MPRLLLLSIALTFAVPALAADGMLEINQTCAVETGCFPGDTAGFPVTLTLRGSYALTSDLEVASGTGVEITTDNVTLDLNGFRISSTGGGERSRDRRESAQRLGTRRIADLVFA